MISRYEVIHYEHVSTKPFEEVISQFEAAAANGDDGKFLNGMAAITNEKDWVRFCQSMFGPSGFLHVLTFDHGHWLSFYGDAVKAKQYTYGNPILAREMLKYDLGVALQVPFRVVIFETPEGEVRISYDLPSSLVSRLNNSEIDEVATGLDDKVVGFWTQLSGASA